MNITDLLVLTMSFTISFSRRISRNLHKVRMNLRCICSGTVKDNGGKNDYTQKMDPDSTLEWKSVVEDTLLGISSDKSDDDEETESQESFSARGRFFESVRLQADRVIEVLQQDRLGIDTNLALDELRLRVSYCLVREVLLRIMKSINHLNKERCAKLGHKFFVWSEQQENYRHTTNTYHLLMKIYADCKDLREMWDLLNQMTEKGFSTTARTFNILICTCGEAGLARDVVERFTKSRTFNFRPHKNSFNAILHSLLVINQHRLIEWVYEKMILEKCPPDILTYNVLMCAKYKLGKMDQLHKLLYEMRKDGIYPDLHTYNIYLHVLGKDNKPLGALNIMNHMREAGCEPRLIHFTSLIDGLSRAGNMEACNYFFNEMVKEGCKPDVVCYTVMIIGYVVARELDKALDMFDEMIMKGQLPNVFTYNAIIRGLCDDRKFEEARCVLREMESRGCKPNLVVYSTILGNLKKAGKLVESRDILVEMVEKGRYPHHLSRYKEFYKGYRRC